MKRITFVLPIIVILSLSAGCARLNPSTPTSTYPPPITTEPLPPTETPRPTVSLPTTPPTATAVPTEAAFSPVSATIVFDNYLLRAGPGRIFDRWGIYEEGDTVLVTARALGQDWVYVQASDAYSGWMNTVGLSSASGFGDLPLMNVPDAILIRGHVWNVDKSPAPYIGVSFQPLNNTNPDLMDTVMTGADLTSALVDRDDFGNYYIKFTLSNNGTQVFGDHTSANVGKYLAIVLDKEVISCPTINDAITSGEETVNSGHAVVTPFKLMCTGRILNVRNPGLFRTRCPDTAAAGVGTQQVGLGGHNFGVLLLGLAVLGAPQVGLTAGHIQEVFPSF